MVSAKVAGYFGEGRQLGLWLTADWSMGRRGSGRRGYLPSVPRVGVDGGARPWDGQGGGGVGHEPACVDEAHHFFTHSSHIKDIVI